MSCLKFKSARLNAYNYLLTNGLIRSEVEKNLDEMSANEDIYTYPLYPRDARVMFAALQTDEIDGKRVSKLTQANNKFRRIANEYYNLNLSQDQDFFEYVDTYTEPQFIRFNTVLFDQVDARRKELGFYNDKLIATLEEQPTQTEEQPDYYREDDIDFLTDLFPSVAEQENIKAQEIATTMANRLAGQTGLSYEVITAEEAAQITEGTNNPWNGEPAFFYNNQVYFVSNGFKLNHVLHEYAHPIVRALYTDNRTLFDRLYKTILNTPEGAELVDTVTNLYPEFDVNDPGFVQEVFVRALEKASVNKAANQLESTGFKKFITNILYGIKQMLRKLFGKAVRVDKLSVDTTLDQLADMLVGENFQLTTQIITQDEIALYLRNNEALYNDLAAVDSSTLNDVLNRYFTNASSILSRIRNNKNYEDFVQAVTTESGRSLIQDITATLRAAESLSVDEKVKKFKDALDQREKQTKAFVRSMIQTDIMADKVYNALKEMESLPDTQTVINKAFYYDLLLRNWSKFTNEAINKLTDSGLRADSSLSQRLANLQNKIDQSNRVINKIYKKGVGGVLFDVIDSLAGNVDTYFTEKIAELESKNASQKEIQKVKAEYAKLKLDRSAVDEYLSGLRGDVNPLSAYIESFSSSPDPVISSFSVFLDNAYAEVDVKATNQTKEYFSELEPALKKAGYSNKNATQLMKQLTFVDQLYIRGKDGKVEPFEKLVMLNPWKGYEAEIDRLEFAIEDARREGKNEEARLLTQELRQFSRDYMHDQYVPEFYEKEKIYDSALGSIAYQRKTALLAEIADIDARVFDDLTEEDAFELKKALWRQYQQLASEYNEDGSKKVGDELEVSKIEKEYRDSARKFYEWKEINGLFQYKFDQFKQDLLDQGLKPGTSEYNDAYTAWLTKNTRVSIKPEFYTDRANILDKIQFITSKLDGTEAEGLDISDFYKEIIEIVKGYRDESNQPIGSELPAERVAKVKQLQERIDIAKGKLAGFSGLTTDEFERYITLRTKSKIEGLTADEFAELDDLKVKKETQALSGIEIEVLKNLYAELAVLQTKRPTEYYYESINNLLSRKAISKDLSDRLFPDKNNPMIDYMNLDNMMDNIEELMELNPDFADWFNKNHIKKQRYNPESKMQEAYYERLYVWNTIQPNSSDYYEKYTYFDTNPVTDEVVEKTMFRIPTLDFYRRAVKAEYRTKREVGKTVDNRGNWLPRTVKEGARDDRFVNKAYFDLQKNDPAKFKVLEVMTKYHLKFQEDKSRSSRLYLDVPRMPKLASEALGVDIKGGVNKAKSLLKQIKSQLVDSEDNFEMGLNFDSAVNLVRADMFDEEISSIPVRGLYRLDVNRVSMNVPYSMIEYMYSLEHQKKLIELNPIAQALQKVVNDPENAIKDTTKINASNFINNGISSFLNKSGKNVRAEAINTLIERDFQGKTRTGLLSEKSGVQKAIDVLQGQATFGMFAMNILPSAVKNFGGAISNIMIEAGGGKYYNAADLLKAAPRAFKAMFDMSSEVYNVGEKSIEYQLIEYFDPIKGRVEERLGSEFGRSVGSDLVDSLFVFGEGRRRTSGFWTAPRKWLQNEATLNSFFAIMQHQQVPMTVNGTTTYIPYVEAWEKGSDGIIKLKDGISEEWGLGGTEFKKIRNATQEVTNNLEGAYSKQDRTMLDRYAVWRLFSALRRYFTRMFINRFGTLRYNARLGNLTEGYYWTVAKSIPTLISRMINGSVFMTQQELYATRKMLTETGLLVMMGAAIAYVFGYDPDDEDRFEKMRERSGDLLSDDFNLAGWLTNHSLVAMLGTRQEVTTFMNPNEYVNLIYSNASPTVGPIVDRYKDFGKDGWFLMTNDKRAFYTRDVGPYSWQKEDEAKIWNDLAYLFGLSGSQVDPVKALKGYEYQMRR